MQNQKIFIRLPEVIKRTGYRRTSIYEKIAEGTFPAPIKLGPRAVAWVSEEIDKWLDARIAERDAVWIAPKTKSQTCHPALISVTSWRTQLYINWI